MTKPKRNEQGSKSCEAKQGKDGEGPLKPWLERSLVCLAAPWWKEQPNEAGTRRQGEEEVTLNSKRFKGLGKWESFAVEVVGKDSACCVSERRNRLRTVSKAKSKTVLLLWLRSTYAPGLLWSEQMWPTYDKNNNYTCLSHIQLRCKISSGDSRLKQRRTLLQGKY